MKESLKRKLVKYSAVAGAVTSVGVAQAQVKYTDIKDTTITGNGNYYDLDLNQDTVPDFRITQYIDSGLAGNVTAILISPYDSAWNTAAGEAINNFNYPFDLTPGSVLSFGTDLKGIGSSKRTGYMVFEVDGISYPNSNWVGPKVNGFLGVLLNFDNGLHFGWARIDVAADNESFTVKDFAVEMSADSSIIVGEELLSVVNNILDFSTIYTSNRNLHVVLTNDIKGVQLSVLDLQGRLLREEDLQGTTEINLADLAAGVYLVNLRYKGVVRSEKIILR